MLLDLLPNLVALWPLLAGGLAAVVVVAAVMIVWGRQRAWRQPVRQYDREQRALTAFRRHLAGTTSRRGRAAEGTLAARSQRPGSGPRRQRPVLLDSSGEPVQRGDEERPASRPRLKESASDR